MTKSEKKKQLTQQNERWDDLMRCGYQILQNPNYFCFGMDAVLLSGFAKINENDQVLDLGTGNGIIPILLAAKTKGNIFFGIEIQETLLDMAQRSVIYNELEDRIKLVRGDLRDIKQLFSSESMDAVVTNPPYMIQAHGLTNKQEELSIARHEIKCDIMDVLAASFYVLKPKGRFFMVHRPFRLAEILSKMRQVGIEPKRMRMVHPFLDKEPNMVLIEGLKDGRSGMIMEKPLIVYQSVGTYTQEINDIYGF